MDDLISKRALLRHLDMAIECKDCPRNTDGITYQKRCACSEVSDICNIITNFATFADVQSVKHGKWRRAGRTRECTVCGEPCICNGDWSVLSAYCPTCGAKMDLE